MVIFLVFIFIFLSRVLFLSISPAFFDSLEYLRLFALPGLGEALKQAHFPIHPLWIAVGWLFNRIPVSTALFKTDFLNGILGTISCFLIYKIARQFVDKNKALLVSLICAFTPYFWLSQVNVLYEPLLGVFLLGSFYFLLKNKLFPAAVFSAGAFLVSSTALIYLVFFAGFLIGRGKLGPPRLRRGEAGALGGGMLLGVLGYLGILGLRGTPAGEFFSVLAAGNSILGKLKLEGVMFFVRGVRNSFLVFFDYLTVPVGIILICRVKRAKKYFFPWLACFLLLNTIWHAGMFGRLGLFLTVAAVFLLAELPEKFLQIILVFLVVYSSFKVLPYRFQKVPYVLEKDYLLSLPEKPLMIIGNYEEPYLQEAVSEYRVLNSPKTDLGEIKVWLEKNLKDGKPVLMTSQAETAPYWQYDGMTYHLLSRRKNFPRTDGQKLLENYKKVEMAFLLPRARFYLILK